MRSRIAVLAVTVVVSLRAAPARDGVPPSGISLFMKSAKDQPPADGSGADKREP